MLEMMIRRVHQIDTGILRGVMQALIRKACSTRRVSALVVTPVLEVVGYVVAGRSHTFGEQNAIFDVAEKNIRTEGLMYCPWPLLCFLTYDFPFGKWS